MMRALRIRNRTRGTGLGDRVLLARWWWERARGLLGRERLAFGEGMLLRPCRAVHMHGMTYPLDVLFIDRERRVLAVHPNLRPGQRTQRHRRAWAALEVPVGTLAHSRTCPGDQLDLDDGTRATHGNVAFLAPMLV